MGNESLIGALVAAGGLGLAAGALGLVGGGLGFVAAFAASFS